jgi:uncharacterized membrane protein
MSEGMARIVALGAGVVLAALIVIVFGASRRTNWLATAIGTVIGVALYLLLTWN